MGVRKTGFTLIELLVTVLIIALMSAIGVPALQSFFERHQALSWQHHLHASLNLTRNHSIYKSVPTVICARDGKACADSGGQWSNGWIIFEDPRYLNHCELGEQGRFCKEGGGRVLRVEDGPDGLEIVNNHNIARRVRFGKLGLSYGYTGRFGFCGHTGKELARGLVIPNTGRIRAARDDELLDC